MRASIDLPGCPTNAHRGHHETVTKRQEKHAVLVNPAVHRDRPNALAGTGKPLVSTSGTLLLAMAGLGHIGTEADVRDGGPRIDAENAAIALAERGIRSSVVRLPPIVHSSLDRPLARTC
ncbi:hypothetical protein OG874_35480 [Nocardia sp. NBC_00565]|uniref:hypothetical protein n=1 Tax=Nocardia sp. NBC_00565 TaxID=2975993 RepID=UPI002E8184D9|nr:hypothetical protein [Nocardia sp. NBC_00565]WUC01995.1 hypothetical protein OG874_35480 [Nocardia sp. NBC_00565]